VACDSHDDVELNADAVPASDLAAIRQVYELVNTNGMYAAMQELMTLSHPEVEPYSYSARGVARPGEEPIEVLRGHDEILSFFRDAEKDGVAVHARVKSLEVEDGGVVVIGSARVSRGDGSFAETKLRWIYRFRDGLVYSIHAEPRAGA
jgi:hypothetical protein